LTDGQGTQFRCFSASQEAQYPSVRESRWRNWELLRSRGTAEGMAGLILDSLPKKAKVVRVHVSGDFFQAEYFAAWCLVARARPDVVFYAYTKSLSFWVVRLGNIPDNLVLTASYGGRHDELIALHNLRYAKVVYSQAEADELGLEVDHDDSHAMRPGDSFALLLHGVQPPGSEASKALSALRAQGDYGYGERADARRVALPVAG
jgi:hypothetical protein